MTRSKLYQPFVEEENVRRLYRLKLLTGKPMTRLINEAVQYYDQQLRAEMEERYESASDALERLQEAIDGYDAKYRGG